MTTKTNFTTMDGFRLSKDKLPKGKAYPISSTAFHDLLKSCGVQPIHGFFMYDSSNQDHSIISIDYIVHKALYPEPGFRIWISAVDSKMKMKTNKAITHFFSNHVRSWWDKLKTVDISSIVNSHEINLLLIRETFQTIVTHEGKKKTIWELPADTILDV